MSTEWLIQLLELFSSVMTIVVLLLFAVIVLLIVLPRLVSHLLSRVADDPAMQHGLAVIRQAVHAGVEWLMQHLIATWIMVLHGLLFLYTAAKPVQHHVSSVKQTDIPDEPSALSPDEPSGASQRQTVSRQTESPDPDTPLMLDIIARVRHEQSKESVMLFLLSVGWSVERIRSTLKGDTTTLTQQIAACSRVLRELRSARLTDAQQQLLRVQRENGNGTTSA